MIAKKPFRPEELLVKWTEFAGEFGSLPELDNYGRQLSFVTYYMLDVFVPALLIAVIVLLGALKFSLFIAKRLLFSLIGKGKKKVE